MISSPGCVCLGAVVPGASSTIVWTTSRPGTLRSCRWRSMRRLHLLRRGRENQAVWHQRRDCDDSSRFQNFLLAYILSNRVVNANVGRSVMLAAGPGLPGPAGLATRRVCARNGPKPETADDTAAPPEGRSLRQR